MVGTWLILAVLFALLLNRTVFGRHLRALGDNGTAARLAGLPIERIQVAVYGLSGLLAGMAGVLLAARTTTGDPNAGVALELDAIAVVVIGGASLSGGRGGIYGTVCGALIIGIVTNILGLRNVGSNAQLMLKAVIIVLAVAAQRSKNRS
jgi:ribose transport system permease protein